jgi:hypothetical protein
MEEFGSVKTGLHDFWPREQMKLSGHCPCRFTLKYAEPCFLWRGGRKCCYESNPDSSALHPVALTDLSRLPQLRANVLQRIAHDLREALSMKSASAQQWVSYLDRCCRRSAANWAAARGGPVCPQTPEIAHLRYRVRGMTVTRREASAMEKNKRC